LHRTQITLTDDQYARLREESAQTGRSLAALVRSALDQRYNDISRAERLELLDEAFGAWSGRRRARGARPHGQLPQAWPLSAMSPLADTSVLIEHLRGEEPARSLMGATIGRGELVSASVLSRIELLIGMRPAERRRTDALITALRWLPVDAAVADRADELARRYARSHSAIDAVDYCVAATAHEHELELWTLNVRHFPMFPRLQAPW
jgi:predicted nucleic acid-binding protein